jgi:TrmH family RNA methyltransferase
MGSIARVEVCYQELENFIGNAKIPVFYTLMEGSNIYEINLPHEGILVMGNEANGISEKLKNIQHQAITIPRFGENSKAESLNVATATAVILSEFRRKN